MEVLDNKSRTKIKNQLEDESSYRVNFAIMRGWIFDALTTSVINSFLNNEDRIMKGNMTDSLISSLSENDPSRILIYQAKDIGKKLIYTERSKSEIELGCFSTFECLLDAFCKAAVDSFDYLYSPPDESSMSWKSKLVLRQLGVHAPSKDNKPNGHDWTLYLCLRRVLDYVSGMTDNYASNLSSIINGNIPKQ